MSIILQSVINDASPDKEFVWLKATAKTNLKGYAIVDRTFDSNENVSNEFRHIFFFPNIQVEKDDVVILCTGKGVYRKIVTKDYNFHRFFWGSKECVWNDNGNDSASLIQYTNIKSIKVGAVKK